MKKYGLRIGEVGVEFSTREDREKAIVIFTKGSTIKISSSGIRYQDSEGAFGTYERESNEVMANCCECKGVFSTETCFIRKYSQYTSWNNKWETSEDYICDACFARKQKAKEVADAKATLENVSN